MPTLDFVSACAENSLSKTVFEYLDAVTAQFQSRKQYWEEESGQSFLPKLFGKKKTKRYRYCTPNYLYALIDAPFLRNSKFSLLFLGYYLALAEQDMSILQSAIYQHVRLDCLRRQASGCDHSLLAVNAIRALSAGDADLFGQLLPERIGAAKEGHPANVAMVNISMGLWYKNEAILASGLALAGKRLALKSETALVKTALRYLAALAENDASGMSAALDELCQNANRDKEGWLRPEGRPLADYIVLFAHGLYQLAFMLLDKDTFERVAYPSARFDKAYAKWLTCAEKPGGPLVRFDGELSILNYLIALIPETRLILAERKAYDDPGAFEEGLLGGLMAQGIDLEAHFRQYNSA